MNIRKQMVGGLMAAAVLALAATTLFATTQTTSGVTLETPSYTQILGTGLIHCEPWNDPTADHVTVSGVTDGSNVSLQFVFTAGVGTPLYFPPVINLTNVNGTFTVNVPYPTDPLTWPYQNGNTHAIIVAVSVVVTTPTGAKIKIGSRQWKVTCITTPDEGDDEFQGCTLGYWKQSQHFDSWTLPFVPEDPGASRFDTVFGVTSHLSTTGGRGGPVALTNPTLLDVLSLGGGGENGMARQAVAAILNAASPGVNFKWTVGEVILIVQSAYAGTIPPYVGLDGNTYTGFDAAHYMFEDQFDGDSRPNECPLN
jgi:hypothetical protein